MSTAAIPTKIQGPLDVLDYTFDWTDELDGDTIQTSTFSATAGITLASPSNTTTTTKVWVSGGTTGSTYTITNKIVTAGGRTEERNLKISIQAR